MVMMAVVVMVTMVMMPVAMTMRPVRTRRVGKRAAQNQRYHKSQTENDAFHDRQPSLSRTERCWGVEVTRNMRVTVLEEKQQPCQHQPENTERSYPETI
jgi:hypothetical protein